MKAQAAVWLVGASSPSCQGASEVMVMLRNVLELPREKA